MRLCVVGGLWGGDKFFRISNKVAEPDLLINKNIKISLFYVSQHPKYLLRVQNLPHSLFSKVPSRAPFPGRTCRAPGAKPSCRKETSAEPFLLFHSARTGIKGPWSGSEGASRKQEAGSRKKAKRRLIHYAFGNPLNSECPLRKF